jgi:hypothetical protein
MVTVAPDTAEPEASPTCPTMEPVMFWPYKDNQENTEQSSKAKARSFMSSSSVSPDTEASMSFILQLSFH